MGLKTAVVLFVRDEVADIACWLAWQFVVGFDTVIVYDDHSVDGTRDRLRAASLIRDVRLHQTDMSLGRDSELPFGARQLGAYRDAMRRYGSEFDWLAFFDADEYLYLANHQSVSDFLEQPHFDDVDAVAINWCIYGCNNHVVKPAVSNVEAFTMHDSPTTHDRMSIGIKSIVRPARVSDVWHTPHAARPLHDRYVDSRGRGIPFPVHGAVPFENVDWTDAKLMHYIVRSMEHYVERIKRRSDLMALLPEQHFQQFELNNRNLVQDLRPLRLAASMNDLASEFCKA